ncbi:MAG: nitroreductase family protein [Actinomycetota bacterium]|nr:nitroreductase family protein [Actinomycetota bacterium]
MEFKEVVRRRRMVRNYAEDPVSPEVIDRIVAAGRKAPSAGFSQGQRFVIVTDSTVRSEIARVVGESYYTEQGFDPWISRAPIHIVVCIREDDYHERYNEPDKLQDDGTEMPWPVPYWWVDGGAALMLLLLAAIDEGLAAGFFGFHRAEGLKQALGIPTDVMPIGIVTIGHPAPDRPSGSLARGWKPAEEVVHRERWDN